MAVLRNKNIVEKRNVLNEIRRNSMTLQELRFFSIYLSKINARDVSTRVVRFPLNEFRKIMEFGRLNVAQLKATTNSLLGKVVNIPTERGGYTGFQLFRECTVDHDESGQWYIEIDAHDKALPLMFEFKRDYFTYELWNALRLKSPNQLRMYELLKQYEHVGKRELPLSELRELLGVAPDEYTRWNNFRVRVIESCREALAENTDLKFTYETINVGRKVIGVRFFIEKNEDYIDQLTLGEFIDLQEEKDAVLSIDVPAEAVADLDDPFAPTDPFDLYVEALGESFTREEVEVLRNLAASHVPYDPLAPVPPEIRIADYLRQKASLMRAQKKPVSNKFAWLRRAVAEDW